MGKHASDIQKAAFLVHLQYIHQVEAARRAGLPKQTATDLKNGSAALQIEREEQGLPPPTLEEQITRKPSSRAKPKTDEEVLELLDSCTLNKKQRKKLWHIIAKEEGGFF